MTVEEFYQFCKEHDIADHAIMIDDISKSGCFIGFKKLSKDAICFGYDDIYGEDMVWFAN